MNYTSNYKLNLPEGRDVVDIEKLNDNFTTLDSQLKSTDSRVTTVDNRVTSVNNSLSSSISSMGNDRKPVTGQYSGDSISGRLINLGFQPSCVLCMCTSIGFEPGYGSMATRESSGSNNYGTLLAVASNGFRVYHEDYHRFLNSKGLQYIYVAWR